MSRTVLVIDRSTIVRWQVVQALVEAGFDVIEAGDGQHGLECAARSSVDLVFCELNMPRMNGIEFLGAFREIDTAGTPIVMLTTEAEPELVSRARSFGARGWIVKPFRPELLVAAARKLTAGAAEARFRSAEELRRTA